MGKEEIASKLKKARVDSGKTQKEVANIIGMTYQAISNYERGKTKVESDILIKLCKIYGISINSVLSDCSNEKNDNLNLLDKSYKEDFRLKKIIDCYKNSDEIGKNYLLEQAEFIQSKHPRNKTNERAM